MLQQAAWGAQMLRHPSTGGRALSTTFPQFRMPESPEGRRNEWHWEKGRGKISKLSKRENVRAARALPLPVVESGVNRASA
jgi:hypothetical protein